MPSGSEEKDAAAPAYGDGGHSAPDPAINKDSGLKPPADVNADLMVIDTATVDGGNVSASSDDADTGQSCNELPESQVIVQEDWISSEVPLTASGGSIADGDYELSKLVRYDPSHQAGQSIEGRAQIIRIHGSSWQQVYYYDNSPTIRHNDEATFAGIHFSLARKCGPDGYGIFFASDGSFSATGTTLTLFFRSADMPKAVWVLTFLRKE